MSKYIFQRLLLAVPTLLGLTIGVFFLIRVLVPVDMVDVASAQTEVQDEARELELRQEFGLTGSLVQQYGRWLGHVLIGDFGRSFYTKNSVSEDFLYRVPTSLELGGGALLITVVLAIPIGLLSAAKQDGLPDYLSRGTAILLYAVPGFWVATLALVFGSMLFNWAPPIDYEHLWDNPGLNVKQMALPMLILGLRPAGTLIRLVRTQVLEVIRQDYVRTARAKGLGTRAVYTRHVLRNALIPIVTAIGLSFPRLIAGTVIFEQIFVLPGVGQYLLDAVVRLDLYVIMATNLFFGAVLILANLVVDVSYAWIDPRIRFATR